MPIQTFATKRALIHATKPDWSVYADSIGSVDSILYRRHHFVVEDHPIVSHMNRILQRILSVAGCDSMDTARAFLVASPSQSARSFANGDIYIGQSLLDRVKSNDELAAVLAHELDHILQYDGISRLESRSKRNSRNFKISAAVLGTAGAYIVATDPNIFSTDASGLENPGLATALLLVPISLYVSASSEIGERSLSRFSAETEFRADSNGAILLRRAGFDPAAMMTLLNREGALYE